MKVIASRAIASMLPGTVPLEDATPALLNKMTSRSPAKASLRAGSWSSRVREAYPAGLNVLSKGHVLGELGHDASVPAGLA